MVEHYTSKNNSRCSFRTWQRMCLEGTLASHIRRWRRAVLPWLYSLLHDPSGRFFLVFFVSELTLGFHLLWGRQGLSITCSRDFSKTPAWNFSRLELGLHLRNFGEGWAWVPVFCLDIYMDPAGWQFLIDDHVGAGLTLASPAYSWLGASWEHVGQPLYIFRVRLRYP